MVFGIGIMIIYFLLFYRCIRTAFVTDDEFSQLNAVGFSAMIACQVLVIIGGIFAIIPLTGIALPLISYGGSSMLTMFFALGILAEDFRGGLTMKGDIKDSVKKVMIVFLFFLVALISYIAYFQVFKAPEIAEKPGNQRAWAERTKF